MGLGDIFIDIIGALAKQGQRSADRFERQHGGSMTSEQRERFEMHRERMRCIEEGIQQDRINKKEEQLTIVHERFEGLSEADEIINAVNDLLKEGIPSEYIFETLEKSGLKKKLEENGVQICSYQYYETTKSWF